MRDRFATSWLIVVLGFGPSAQAQEDAAAAHSGLHAQVTSVLYYSDNFYNQPANKTSAFGALVTPQARFLRQTSKLELAAEGQVEYGVFDQGSADNYLDGAAALRAASQPTLRNYFRAEGAFKRGHDPFGVDRTEDATSRDADLDEWDRTTFGLRWRYGAPGARMNAELGGSILEKKYVTNRAMTEPLSYDSTRVDYTLFYHYSEKTSALLDFSREDFSFDRAFGVVDLRGGELYRVRTGVKWLATGKTSGDVRVGYRRRLFDAGGSDIEGLDWEAGVDWAPIPRALLRLEMARSEQESYTVDARVIDVESLRLDGKYNLTSRTRGSVRLDRLTADFDASGREDEILGLAVGAEHLALSYLWLVGHVGFNNRDSNVAAREYDRINAFLGVRLGR